MAHRTIVVLLTLMTLAAAAPLALPLAPAAVPASDASLVVGPHAAAQLAALGVPLLDDYGAFATAIVPKGLESALNARGLTMAPLDATTGRGTFRFDARAGDGLVPPALRSEDAGRSIVAFRGPVKQDWRAALDKAATVYDYLPGNSFLVRGDRAALQQLPGVLFVGPYHAGYKLAPVLAAKVSGTSAESSGVMGVTLLTYPDENLDRAAQAVAATGARLLDMGHVAGLEGILKVAAQPAQFASLARIEAVSWMEPTLGPASVDNEKATAIVQSGDATTRAVNAKGVDGSSQVASICDTGVDTTGTAGSAQMVHEMFSDATNPTVTYQQVNPNHRKILLYYSPVEGAATKGDFDDGDSHGTHTGGTIAGDAAPFNSANNHDSGAYAAKLAVCDIVIGTSFNIPTDYSLMWAPAYGVGARVNSNSWGSGPLNEYTDVARQEDAYVWAHRDFSIFRSAGNTGPTGNMRPESVAKDVLSVASSLNSGSGDIEALSGFSSRGPSADGRLKPDVDAPGECLMSARQGTSNQYVCESGTSMATPTASAAAVLLRDYFAKGYWPGGVAGSGPALDPSTAMMRALLYASGHEMTGANSHAAVYAPGLDTNPALAGAQGGLAVQKLAMGSPFFPVNTPASTFPNGNQGWGRITLDSVLYFQGDTRKLFLQDEAAGLTTGDSRTFTVHVSDGAQSLRIVAAWTDFQGAAGANPALVNDLDVKVTAPDGTAYNGNVWLGSSSVQVPLVDHLNNAEGVEFPAPAVGDYVVTVTGSNVPQGPQPFALVATGGLA